MEEVSSIVKQNQIQTNGVGSTNNLGKDAFLQLMVLQMKNQDPLNPMDNQAMLSQMAQFSSLEQMSNLNDTMSKSNNQSAFMQTASLLGKEVAVMDPAAEIGTDGTVVSRVQSVGYSEDGPVMNLENGLSVGIEGLLGVRNSAE